MSISKTGYAILGVLSIEPLSGYGIREFMKENTSGFWTESDGQIYPAVKKLLSQKLIKVIKSESKGDKRKTMYDITKKGKDALASWLKEDAEKNSIRDEFILKLFCGANSDVDVNIDHINKKMYDIKKIISNLEKVKILLAEHEKESQHYLYWDSCIEYGLTIQKAKLQWCESVIKKLLRGVKK